MADKPRVVVTGIGAVTSLGLNVETSWKRLLAGESGIAPFTLFDAGALSVQFGGEVKDFVPEDFIPVKEARRMDRFSQLGMAAAKEAIEDSGLDLEKIDRTRAGCIVGSGIGGLMEILDQHSRYLERGQRRVSPYFVPKMMLNAAAGNIAIAYGLGGPNWGVASACASANHAITSALRTIQYGDADIMVTGGTEAALTPITVSGFANAKALSTRGDDPTKASRPFDKNRDGFVLGEGAGLLVFERLDHALARGARIYAEVLGAGNSDDAHHITAPDPEGDGGARAMKEALKDAGVKPGEVNFINAHGTSTPLNDRVETVAIRKTLGDHADKVAVNSTKSMIGHLLGAAAGVELVFTIKSVHEGMIHPTINYESPDPECDLDCTPNEKREMDIRVAFSNSLGFGGHNSTVVVGKHEN